MDEERKDQMVSHGKTDTGVCPWSSGVIAGYPGHSLGIALAQIKTCPTDGIKFDVSLGALSARRSWLLTAPPGSLG
jgi:hypothetical protein